MPVKKDPSGQRSVEAEVEVPGTPEEVWAAISTGPGISSWFVPSTVEGREGGSLICDFGPEMVMEGTIRTWDPPHRYVVETMEGPGAVATEWIVEARSGGTCVVRVVHSWFASGDDWDDQFEGHEKGWASFFRILQAYLTHFPGEPSATLQLMGASDRPETEAWRALLEGLGVADADVGDHGQAPAGAPPFGGIVIGAPREGHPELMMRLEKPVPGIAHVFAMPLDGQVLLPMRLYLYGDDAEDAITRDGAAWNEWMGHLFGDPAAS